MSETVRLTEEKATALVAAAFEASDVSPANALSTARALVAAEADGQVGHGFSRVLAYAAQAKAGKVRGHAVPEVSQAGPALLRVDAGFGFAFPALDLACARLAALTRETGIAAAAVHRSHHCGQLGAHVERLAKAGLVAIMVANTPRAMAAWGGTSALFGTNPIAFGAPREGHEPLVIDLSLSKIARGKIMAADQRGEAIPEGWALDAEGNPTTDAGAALKGTLVPAGGAKGAALALMVEVLAASLTGAVPSREATSFFDAEGAPPGVGQFLIAVDPGAASGGTYTAAFEALAAAIEAEDGARLPGTSRHARREAARRDGLTMSAALHGKIAALAQAG